MTREERILEVLDSLIEEEVFIRVERLNENLDGTVYTIDEDAIRKDVESDDELRSCYRADAEEIVFDEMSPIEQIATLADED